MGSALTRIPGWTRRDEARVRLRTAVAVLRGRAVLYGATLSTTGGELVIEQGPRGTRTMCCTFLVGTRFVGAGHATSPTDRMRPPPADAGWLQTEEQSRG